MRVGILTFHDGINYGAYLQVYALKSMIEQIGHEVSVINYKQGKFWLKEYLYFLKKGGTPIRNLRKIDSFRKLHSKYLNLTKLSFFASSISKNFDAVVFGADEIWNTRNPGFGFDPTYFGAGVDCIKKVSYGPSFGASDSVAAKEENIERYLKSFLSLSVRDYHSRDILEELGFSNTSVVPDPTLLHPASFFVQKKVPIENNILLYSAEPIGKEMQEKIRKYASERNRKIISIGYEHKFADINYADIGVDKWLELFMGAGEVITSMFHGVMFSLIFEKKFGFIYTEYRKNKLSAVVDVLGLDKHMIDEEPFTLEYRQGDNYQRYKQSGVDYLREALAT